MTIATMPRGVRMRPIASPDDSFTAAAILAQAATDDLDSVTGSTRRLHCYKYSALWSWLVPAHDTSLSRV